MAHFTSVLVVMTIRQCVLLTLKHAFPPIILIPILGNVVNRNRKRSKLMIEFCVRSVQNDCF